MQAGWECQELHALAEVVLALADPLVDWEVEVGCVVWLVMAEACKNIVDRELDKVKKKMKKKMMNMMMIY